MLRPTFKMRPIVDEMPAGKVGEHSDWRNFTTLTNGKCLEEVLSGVPGADWRSDGCVLWDSVTGQKGETALMTDEASNSAADGCWGWFWRAAPRNAGHRLTNCNDDGGLENNTRPSRVVCGRSRSRPAWAPRAPVQPPSPPPPPPPPQPADRPAGAPNASSAHVLAPFSPSDFGTRAACCCPKICTARSLYFRVCIYT